MAKHQTTTDIRHPYYDMGDKLNALHEAVDGDPVLWNDDKLQGILIGIRADINRLQTHLNKNYLWD